MNRYIANLRLMLLFWIAGIAIIEGHSAEIKNNNIAEAPPMVCNDLVHISLDTLCTATVYPHMLLEDLTGSPLDYRIKVYNTNGSEQSDLSFDNTDIKKKYNYKIWHLPSGNSCWGQIFIEDKYAPEIACRIDTVRCGLMLDPEIIGFPIPSAFTVSIDSVGPHEYKVSGWDACGVVILRFTDAYFNNQCDSLCFRKLVREWTAVDESGNTSRCADTICILRPTESDITYPPNYDNFELPALSCDTNYIKLPNGNPSPASTGWPIPIGCSTLNASFTDLKINTCGNTFKILRRWIILNWCTGFLTEYNQIIKVIDNVAPIVDCPSDFTIGMQLYSCQSYGKLPPPDSVYDCNTWTYDIFTLTHDSLTGIPKGKSKSYIVYDAIQQCYFLVGAPQGRLWLIYQVTDACGNSTECTLEVGVVDNLVPIPICDQKTVVALGIDGTARVFAHTFDDRSIDNCGIDTFFVRRMNDPCNTGTNVFGPYVNFCCADVGTTVMVALEVVDFYGNRNTCMVEATVQDKEPPVIVPPTDITIGCTFPIDFNNLNKFGFIRFKESDRKPIVIADPFYVGTNFVAGIDGLANDNCVVSFTERVEKDINCSSGFIRRIFTVTDQQGLTSTAVQTITIINTDPFDVFDIFWPQSIDIFSCNNVSTHPDQTGYPIYSNTNCAQIAANYDDTKLTVLDSTCYKILRRWYVIDWCQYDRINNRGYWEYTQVIAIKNSEPPVIFTCGDVEICDQSAFVNVNTGLCMGSYQLKGIGFDDCTDVQNLIWQHRIDENNDGSFGPVINGDVASGVLPIGIHRLRWILIDQCGNVSTCDQVFTIKDCKKPTPYCFNGIITVIMPGNGNVTVWAKDLNIGSFDNCTSSKDLKFSFTSNVNDVSIIYNCDSLNLQKIVTKTVRIYVTDEYGNQDYCETTIRIQDNNNVCPGTNPGFNLSGKIKRENQDALSSTTVSLLDPSGNLLDQKVTNPQGDYAFENINVTDFYLKAYKADGIINGVSTLDIVLIQRHILGIKVLNSPYKILAADANNSNSITSKDVSDIRKAILGVVEAFPNQTPIWKFIKADHQFANPLQPWDALTIIESSQLQDKLDQAHFFGIKTGDVDLSADVQNSNPAISRNNNLHWVYKHVFSESELIIEMLSETEMMLDGFQIGMNLNSENLVIKEIRSAGLEIGAEEYVINKNQIKISSGYSHARHIKSGEVLFKIVVSGNATNQESAELIQPMIGFSNEAYLNQEMQILKIRNEQDAIVNATMKLISYPLQPNPFSEEAIIAFELPGAGKVGLQVYDLSGKRLFIKERTCEKGKNEIKILKSDFAINGLMYYVLTSPFGTASEKMFVIE